MIDWDNLGLTRTERLIVSALEDGKYHPEREVAAVLDDPSLVTRTAVSMHICRIRVKINPAGLDFALERRYQRLYVRLVRLLHPS